MNNKIPLTKKESNELKRLITLASNNISLSIEEEDRLYFLLDKKEQIEKPIINQLWKN